MTLDWRSFRIYFLVIIGSLVGGSFGSVHAASETTMKEDKGHVYKWNKFARDILALHKELIKNKKVKKETRVGGYATDPNYYKEEKYYDVSNGKLISKIQWETANPDNIHVIEVYVRNKQGKVIRDYIAAFLPHARNAPVQTLINLHKHKNKVHGFRQFDATGDLIYEQCEGEFNGKKFVMRIFEDDLVNGDEYTDKLMKSVKYRDCFQGIPKTVKKLLEKPS